MLSYWPSLSVQIKYAFLMVCVMAAGVVVLWITNLIKLRKSGINPLTAEADIINKVLASQAMAPNASIEDRLAELDRLKFEGKISDEEHSAARAAVLGGK